MRWFEASKETSDLVVTNVLGLFGNLNLVWSDWNCALSLVGGVDFGGSIPVVYETEGKMSYEVFTVNPITCFN
jgi:hypothetical protein